MCVPGQKVSSVNLSKLNIASIGHVSWFSSVKSVN